VGSWRGSGGGIEGNSKGEKLKVGATNGVAMQTYVIARGNDGCRGFELPHLGGVRVVRDGRVDGGWIGVRGSGFGKKKAGTKLLKALNALKALI
jgi:hypothetical protein